MYSTVDRTLLLEKHQYVQASPLTNSSCYNEASKHGSRLMALLCCGDGNKSQWVFLPWASGTGSTLGVCLEDSCVVGSWFGGEYQTCTPPDGSLPSTCSLGLNPSSRDASFLKPAVQKCSSRIKLLLRKMVSQSMTIPWNQNAWKLPCPKSLESAVWYDSMWITEFKGWIGKSSLLSFFCQTNCI